MRAVCVYAASSDSVAPHFLAVAAELGALLAGRGLTLIYGGGKVGLMGACARAVHSAGGRVVGVIPAYLRTVELAYEVADELIETSGLRERKATMEARADAFIALPGGFGTLEEMLEALTLKQLRQHTKPVIFLNTAGFYDPLLAMFDRLYVERFTRIENAGLYHVAATADDALAYLASYEPSPITGKWL
jgi:cytokinin riboside 5'-monophosphate phosphoribohydrolase